MKQLQLLASAFAMCFLLLGTSCHKDHGNTTPDTPFTKLRSGSWNWVMSNGGLVGGTNTPATTGMHLTREFAADGNCKTTSNGTISNEHYATSEDSTWAPGQITDWVNIAGTNYNMWYAHDTLVLTTDYVDGTTDYYTKL